jgi:hypothetical protein
MEWIHYTKRSLDSIKKLTQLSQDRFIDKEFGKFLSRMIIEDIHQADLWLNSFLGYFHITHPIQKTHTVNTLLEEGLKKNQVYLEEKGVQHFQKLEKDLPEIVVPDEPLKYILNSLLQYIITSTRPNGNIEFLTRSFFFQGGGGEPQACLGEDGGGVEILVVFTDMREPMGPSGVPCGHPPPLQEDEAMELMLRLVKEMVQKHRGIMKCEGDEKRSKTIISLRFPVERRKVFFYEPRSTNPPAKPFKILDS